MRVVAMRARVLGALLCALPLGVIDLGCATTKEASTEAVREPPREPWRATRPAAAPADPLKFPAPARAELKNGLTLIVVEDHGLPLVHASVVVKAGASLDGKDAGLAALTWDLVDEGAGAMNAGAVDAAFGEIGTEVVTYASTEFGEVSSEFLKKNADRGLELLAQIVQKPTFAQADFDRLKKVHFDAITAQRGDPSALAAEVLAAEVFGVDHAYGHPADGTAATVEKLKQSSVKRFWSDNVGPKAAALVLVGDVTLDEAKALAEKHFGKWKGGAKGPKAPPTPKPRTQAKIIVIDFPDAPQTQIRMARPLAAANDVDEAALTVVNQVVGGMFNSRLNLKLREEKGWTYGAQSEVDLRLGVGPFLIATDVQASASGDAVVEIFNQLDALKSGGVTEEELALAKANYMKTIPSLFALPPALIGFTASGFVLGLAPDHEEKLVANVGSVGAEQAKAAAARAIVKEDFVVVLVGDRQKITAGLQDKNLGELVFLNKDGTPAPAVPTPAAPTPTK